MLLEEIITKIRMTSSIGYLDVNALKTYDVDNQEIVFESILYVKDKNENKYKGYVSIYNDTVGVTLHEYCVCNTITTKGKMLLVDNVDKLIGEMINQ